MVKRICEWGWSVEGSNGRIHEDNREHSPIAEHALLM